MLNMGVKHYLSEATTEKPDYAIASNQRMSVRKQDGFTFTTTTILEFLDFRKDTGATVAEIVEATGFTRQTIYRHLDYLVASREVYVTSRSVYHKNGKIVHYTHMKNKVFDRRHYTFYLLEQNFGEKSIYIQEKEIGKLKTLTVKGGIMVRKNEFQRFLGELTKFAIEMEKNEPKT